MNNFIKLNQHTSSAKQIIADFAMDLYNLRTDEMVFVCGRGFQIRNDQCIANENKLDLWNDSINLFDKNYFKSYDGTVDASEYFVKNPMVKAGTAFALTGLTKLVLGDHRGKRAFVQACDMLVLRDTNKNGVWEEKTIHKVTAANLHAASSFQIKDKVRIVGRNSAVCTVPELLWTDFAWNNDFIKRADLSGQKHFYRLYVDVRELALYMGEKYNNRTNKDYTNVLYEYRQKLTASK